ncbi:unnamed protein product, partial [marine sediment metagenome]
RDLQKISDIIEEILSRYSRLEDKNTNPGFIISEKQPSLRLYENAVKEVVSLKNTEKILQSSGAYYKGYKNRRGLIGATASIAWLPISDKTYELIAYRDEEKWGTERVLDESSVKKMDKNCPSTFDNYDYENHHNRIAPNSPCPILYGIRGDDDKELLRAISFIKSEQVNSWMIFETNQGTDDHLQRKTIDSIKPYNSVITKGTVTIKPYTIKGGHVIFTIKDYTGEIDCAAYEPTKNFRNVIRRLD